MNDAPRPTVRSGIDVVAIERVGTLLDRFGDSFVERIYTADEAAYCRSRPAPAQHFAARWAAKEAARKALPETGEAIPRSDVEVVRDGDAPELALTGAAADAAATLGSVECDVSLSHDRTLGEAAAQVILLGGRPAPDRDGGRP